MKKALVTGGAGYIGSHTATELLLHGYDVVIADDLSNSNAFIINRIEQVAGRKPRFYKLDLCDLAATEKLFQQEKIFDVVVHFAAFKAVGESMEQPLKYFRNNIVSLLNVVECMNKTRSKNLVFSSSATVYGDPDILPVKEESPFKKALSAYGSTKQMGEEILEKISATGSLNVIALRYFNPVGARPSALLGELPQGRPNNLLPFVTQTAIGKLPLLTLFGNDYNTKDGTCIRDYVHVVDLGLAHIKACDRLTNDETTSAYEVFNIGTGNGISVKELVNSFEEENGVKVNYVFGPRRAGDTASLYADAAKANELLQWKAEKDVKDMVKDAWRWEKQIQENSNSL